jgi:hypothetical protein
LTKQKAIFEHFGKFNETALNDCVNFHENYFFKEKISSKATKKSIYVIIESFHNVLKHSQESKHLDKTILKTFHLDNVISIHTSNIVNENTKLKLKQLISTYKKKSIDELKAFYQTNVLNSNSNDPSNSNLGIALMLISSDKNFNYRFVPLTNKKHKFNLKITIKIKH